MRRDVDQPGPPMPPAAIRTTCPYCGVGCGVLATPDGRGGAAIAGDPSHPANLGRLCSKGAALGETLGLGSRVLHPLRRTASGSYERVGWRRRWMRSPTGSKASSPRMGRTPSPSISPGSSSPRTTTSPTS